MISKRLDEWVLTFSKPFYFNQKAEYKWLNYQGHKPLVTVYYKNITTTNMFNNTFLLHIFEFFFPQKL